MLQCMLVCVGLCIDIIDTSNHVYNIYGLWENRLCAYACLRWCSLGVSLQMASRSVALSSVPC